MNGVLSGLGLVSVSLIGMTLAAPAQTQPPVEIVEETPVAAEETAIPPGPPARPPDLVIVLVPEPPAPAATRRPAGPLRPKLRQVQPNWTVGVYR